MYSLLLVTCMLFGAATYAADKPNLVFILADDMGYGDVSPKGQRTHPSRIDFKSSARPVPSTQLRPHRTEHPNRANDEGLCPRVRSFNYT